MRTENQMGLYWGLFKDAWAARQRLAGTPPARDVWRKMLHVRAGAVDRQGRPKSSKNFTNADLDEWKRVCLGIAKAGLAELLEVETQPVKRALFACAPYLDALQMEPEQRVAYIAGIYRNVQRKRVREEGAAEFALEEMPDADLGLVVAALKHTAEHKLGAAHRHPRSDYARGRARYAHHVGERTGDMDAPAAAEEAGELGRDEPAYVPPGDHPF